MGGTPIAGWFMMGKSHRSKWMMTGGTPMTQETSIHMGSHMKAMRWDPLLTESIASTSNRLTSLNMYFCLLTRIDHDMPSAISIMTYICFIYFSHVSFLILMGFVEQLGCREAASYINHISIIMNHTITIIIIIILIIVAS